MQKFLHCLTILFLLLLSITNLQAQEPCVEGAPFPPPGLTCDDAPILCALEEISGYCAIMPPPPASGNQPVPLCGANTIVNNIIWFGFVASGPTVTIEALIEDCTTTPDGQTGVQYGIYTDCSFATAILCNGASNVGPQTITSNDFVAGETYFVFFDGFGGSVCQITIDITVGGGEYNVAEPSAIENDFNGDLYDPPFLVDQVCQGGEINFFAVDIPASNTEDYWWTITPATSDYPTGIITVPDDSAPVNDTYTVYLDLSDAGSYEICAYAYTGCDTSLVQCQIIEVVPLPDEILDDWYVCENEFPSAGPPEWEGGIINGPGGYFEELEDAFFSCDYSQTLEVISVPLQAEEIVTLAVCDYDFTNQYNICSQVVFGDQTNTYIVCPNEDMNMCDSMIILTIDFINVIGNLQDPTCDNGQLVWQWVGAYPQPDNFTSIVFNLYRDNVLVFSANADSFNPNVDFMNVDIVSGTYFVEIVVQKFGEECIFSSNLEFIDVDNLFPDDPAIGAWAVNPCILDSVSYFLADNVDPTLTYIWDVTPSANLIIADDSSTVIGINWENANPNITYEICVTADNGCGLSLPICENISVLAQPMASFTAPDVVCLNETAVVQYNGSSLSGGTYTWNFGGGNVGGANTNAPGPFDVNYSTPGIKIVTVNVNQGSCNSEIFTDTILVVSPLSPPLILCTSETDSIGFSWDPIAEGYTVTVISAPGTAVFIETDSSFSVTNLVPNDVVSIEVTAIDGGPCDDVFTIEECIAQNCPPIDISLNSPVDTICLDASAGSFDLTAVVNPPISGAISSWSGNGIIDTDAGTFNPDVAGVGNHQILFDYETDCDYSQSLNIVVVEQPISSFIATDTICITGQAMINYSGTFSNGDFTWDYDGGTPMGAGSVPTGIRWNTPGIKNVTAVVGNGDCLSEVFTQSVLVQDTLSKPLISCEQETEQIIFTWNDVTNATEYEVFINGVSQGFQSATSILVDGLVPGNMVDISVVAISDNLCPNASSFTSCEALNCPSTFVNLSTSSPFICLDGNTGTVQIDSDIVGGDDEATYNWSGSGINQTGIFDATVAGVGVHDIVLEYNNLNCFEYDTIVMTVFASPIASFTTQTNICVTDTFIIDFDGSFADVASFDWSLNGGNISGVAPGPYKVWFNSAGTFDISLQLEENLCLSNAFTQTVTVEDELQLPNPGFDCDATTSTIFFSWPAVDCATEYIIFVNGVEQETQAGTDYFISDLDANQNVDFEIVAISECACGDAAFDVTCATMACPPIDLVISEVADICLENSTATLQLTVEETGSTGLEQSTWIGNGMDQNGIFDPQAAGAGIHNIIYSLNDANCNYIDNIAITVFESPQADLLFSDPTCFGEEDGTIMVTPTGGDGNYSVFINDEQIETGALAELPGANYTIEVIDGNGCAYTEIVSLTVPSEQVIGIQGLTSIVAGDTSSYSINSNIPIEDITNIQWIDQNGNIICEGIQCTTIDFGPIEDDSLCLTITYGEGCISQSCIDIRSEKIKQVYIPNVFTPNEDGVNDFFNVFPNNEVVEIPLVQIYNRWGEKMFEATDVALDGTAPNWDGTFKGKSLNPGVYVYVVSVLYKDGLPEIISGDITIIR